MFRKSSLLRVSLGLLVAGLLMGWGTPLVAYQTGIIAEPPPAEEVRPALAPKPTVRSFESRLKEYLDARDGTYGLYVIDLNSGATAGYNSDEVFPTASTFKLPLAMYLLDEAGRGRVNLSEKLAYAPSDWEAGTGTLQGAVKAGDRFTVRHLLELAITESDNIATNMLVRRFGPQNVYAYMKRTGGTVTHFQPGVPGTTPREMAGYMQAAAGNQAVGDQKLRQFLLGALSRTRFHTRVEAGVPKGVVVAHKIGTLAGVVNDVALVYAPGRPFVIAAYSMGVDEQTAEDVIAEVTRIVYAEISAGYFPAGAQ